MQRSFFSFFDSIRHLSPIESEKERKLIFVTFYFPLSLFISLNHMTFSIHSEKHFPLSCYFFNPNNFTLTWFYWVHAALRVSSALQFLALSDHFIKFSQKYLDKYYELKSIRTKILFIRFFICMCKSNQSHKYMWNSFLGRPKIVFYSTFSCTFKCEIEAKLNTS